MSAALRLSVGDRRWRYKVSFTGERPGNPGKRFELDVAYVVSLRNAIRVASDSDLDCAVLSEGNLVIARRAGVWTCRDGSPLREVNGKPLADLLQGQTR